MRGGRAPVLVLVLCGAVLLLLSPPASADVFGAISLVSTDGSEQTGFAHDAAVSGNGRYVAFDGVFAGRHGVWRRDLSDDAVEEVSGERLAGEGSAAGTAALPSISEDGQYVSFTSAAQLAPNADQNQAPDVYVRNMSLPESAQSSPQCAAEEKGEVGAGVPGQSCPFTLVSAVNGRAEGLTYAIAGASRYGAVASGRSAITADGHHVVFVTTAASNLLDPAQTSTPAMQVVVRDIETQQSELVSVRDEPASGAPAVNPETGGPEAVLGGEGYSGAVYSDAATSPPEFKGPQPYALTPPLGASISSDGSTVAWMAVNVAEQAKVLAGEAHLNPRYTEPLWRRIGEGTGAHTRRITGGSDPESPACAASGEQVLSETRSDPCQGPFYVGSNESNPGIWKGASGENFVPQLSADGYTVAFLAQAPTLTRAEGFARGLDNSDLYVANMRPGLTRTEALQPLTALASGNESDLATTGAIVDFGLSPDGDQVAFSTQRTQFQLGTPAYVSEPMPVPGMSELFDVDLNDATLTRVTQGFAGGPGEHPHQEAGSGASAYGLGDGALSPSFSDDGDLLAFSSTAANLVYGDGNTPPLVNGQLEKTEFDGSDAFVVGRIPFTATPTETYVSTLGAALTAGPEWKLGVTAGSLTNGEVRLYVTVPGAGRLSAGAKSIVHLTHRLPTRKGHRPGTVSTLASRTVAKAGTAAGADAAILPLTLSLASPYRALAGTKGGLAASVDVSFAAPGHRTLTQTITVSFKRRTAPKKRERPPRSRKRAG